MQGLYHRPEHTASLHPGDYAGTLQGTLRGPLGRHNCLNAHSNPPPGKLLSCPPSWAVFALQHLPARLPTSPALSWGLCSPSPASHSDLCLLPLNPESCLVDFLRLATSTRIWEESVGGFPQYHYLPFSFCSFLLLEVANTWPSLCQHVGAKNAVTLLHMFFSLSCNRDTYLMLGILRVLSHVMLSTILWHMHCYC